MNDDLERKCVDARDTLLYRKLRGESLSHKEYAFLIAMTWWLNEVLPKPERLPLHIRQLIDEILEMPDPMWVPLWFEDKQYKLTFAAYRNPSVLKLPDGRLLTVVDWEEDLVGPPRPRTVELFQAPVSYIELFNLKVYELW